MRPLEYTRLHRKGPTLGGVAIAIALIGALLVIHLLTTLSRPQTFAGVVADYQTRHPDAAAIYSVLRDDFPAEYKALGEGITEHLHDHLSRREIEIYMVDYIQTFISGHSGDIQKAPPAALAAVRKTQSAFYLALQAQSPALCARYDRGYWVSSGALNATSTRAADAVDSALMSAIAAAQKQPTPHDPPTSEDQYALSAELERGGITKAQRRLLMSDNAFAAAPAVEQCSAAVLIVRAQERLGGPAADRLTAETYRKPDGAGDR